MGEVVEVRATFMRSTGGAGADVFVVLVLDVAVIVVQDKHSDVSIFSEKLRFGFSRWLKSQLNSREFPILNSRLYNLVESNMVLAWLSPECGL